MKYKRLLVTGGAGFIGSSFIRYGLTRFPECQRVVNLDLLTYAADLRNLCVCDKDSRYLFVHGDVCDEKLIDTVCKEERIEAIVHFAAQTHVDRSIVDPRDFFHTNISGTLSLLESVRKNKRIHYHHISTDEVYGSLTHEGYFSETSPYRPNSPYAASKAASDHCVLAYAKTYDISVTLSHCSNNYGPCQHVEKFIPRMIAGLLHKQSLPIYGTGINVRDWIYVEDHSEAVWALLNKGRRGEVYDIGGQSEKTNLQVVDALIDTFSQITGEDAQRLRTLITFVPDRLGHDFRYAIDASKMKTEMSWQPEHDFAKGLHQTIRWYLDNPERLKLT